MNLRQPRTCCAARYRATSVIPNTAGRVLSWCERQPIWRNSSKKKASEGQMRHRSPCSSSRATCPRDERRSHAVPKCWIRQRRAARTLVRTEHIHPIGCNAAVGGFGLSGQYTPPWRARNILSSRNGGTASVGNSPRFCVETTCSPARALQQVGEIVERMGTCGAYQGRTPQISTRCQPRNQAGALQCVREITWRAKKSGQPGLMEFYHYGRLR